MKKGVLLVVLIVLVSAFLIGQPAAEKKIEKVRFWHSFSEGVRLTALTKIINDFEMENPNIKIEVEVYPWGEFTTKWMMGVSTGDLPDVSSVQHSQLPSMYLAGILDGVDGVINEIGKDKFYQQPLSYLTIDGKILAIPFYNIARVLWYRKDILAKNNVQPPQTWDEYLNLAKKLGSPPDIYGQVVPFSKSDGNSAAWLYGYVRSKGASLVTADGKVNLTSPEVLEGIRFWIDMYKAASPVGSINYGTTETSNMWYQGRTVFDINTGFHIDGVLRNAPDLDGLIGAAPLPKASLTSLNRGEYSDYMCLTMYNTTKVPEAATKFLKYLYDDERYVYFLHQIPGGMLPARKDIAESKSFWDHETMKKYQKDIAVVLDGIENGSLCFFDQGLTLAGSVLSTHRFIAEMYHRILVDGVSVERAAREAEGKYNEVIHDLSM